MGGVRVWGLPLNVRCDHGLENVGVYDFLLERLEKSLARVFQLLLKSIGPITHRDCLLSFFNISYNYFLYYINRIKTDGIRPKRGLLFSIIHSCR